MEFRNCLHNKFYSKQLRNYCCLLPFNNSLPRFSPHTKFTRKSLSRSNLLLTRAKQLFCSRGLHSELQKPLFSCQNDCFDPADFFNFSQKFCPRPKNSVLTSLEMGRNSKALSKLTNLCKFDVGKFWQWR